MFFLVDNNQFVKMSIRQKARLFDIFNFDLMFVALRLLQIQINHMN